MQLISNDGARRRPIRRQRRSIVRFAEGEADQDGPRIVVNAITANGQRLPKNQEVKVIRFENETGVYIVEAVKPEKD